mgnify:CR=1 FL=1
MAVPVNKIGTEICEALGIQANDVMRLSFDWEPGEVATVIAKLRPSREQAEKIAAIFKKYKLIEMDSYEEERQVN